VDIHICVTCAMSTATCDGTPEIPLGLHMIVNI
jgi:hypothetical protein